MESREKHRKESWLTGIWAAVFCICVVSLVVGCGSIGTVATQDPFSVGEGTPEGNGLSEADTELPGKKEAGSSPAKPIPAEPGMRLLEGVYYICDIDDTEGAEIFCYLGSQDNGYPRFWIDSIPMTMSHHRIEAPFTANVKNEEGVYEKREVYYLVDILEGDGQREFALLDHGEKVANHTVICNYERSQMLWVGNVEGIPFAKEHTTECGARERIGFDGQGHIITTFASDLAQLWSLYQTWEMAEGSGLAQVMRADGMYEAVEGSCPIDEGGVLYPNTMNSHVYEPYLYHALEVYTIQDKNAEVVVWNKDENLDPVQSRVTFTHTDNEHWIRLELADGQIGWIYLEAPEVLVQSNGLTYMDYAIFDLKPLAWKYEKLSYEERRDLLRQQALEKEPITVEVHPEGTQLSSGVLYQADLDDDGVLERFYYDGALMRDTMRPLFIIDGKEYEIGKGFQPVIFWGSRIFLGNYEEYYLCDIRIGDGQTEFAFGDESDDDGCHETDWLSFDGTWMRYIGTIDGFPFDQGDGDNEWTYKLQKGIWGLDGQGHVGTCEKMGPLKEMWVDVVWILDPDSGMLVKQKPEDGWYVNNGSRHVPFQGDHSDGNWSHYYLQNDLPLYREPDLNANIFEMKVQAPYYCEQVYLTHTDGQHWVRVENQDGQIGWMYLKDGKPVLSDKYMQQELSYYIQQVFVYKDWTLEDDDTFMDQQTTKRFLTEQYPFLEEEPQPVELSGEKTEVQLQAGMMYAADLDGDGTIEEFAYCGLAGNGNVTGSIGNVGPLYPTFWIDGQIVQSGYMQVDGFTPDMVDEWGHVLEGQKFYLCDIRKGDGKLELATLDPGPSWDPVTTFLRWSGKQLDLVGRVFDFSFVRENPHLAEEYADEIYGLDGGGNVIIRARANVLQTWWLRQTWSLNRRNGKLELAQPKNGLFENTDPYYYREYQTESQDGSDGPEYPYLVADLTLYRCQDLESETFVMAVNDHGVENKIYFTHTDNVHWVRVVDDAGASGWIYLENFGDMILPDGKKSVYDYIGGLNMAD